MRYSRASTLLSSTAGWSIGSIIEKVRHDHGFEFGQQDQGADRRRLARIGQDGAIRPVVAREGCTYGAGFVDKRKVEKNENGSPRRQSRSAWLAEQCGDVKSKTGWDGHGESTMFLISIYYLFSCFTLLTCIKAQNDLRRA